MEFRNLGHSGLRVSAVGLGCNNFGMKLDEAGTGAVVHAAIDAGITLFDMSTAETKPARWRCKSMPAERPVHDARVQVSALARTLTI